MSKTGAAVDVACRYGKQCARSTTKIKAQESRRHGPQPEEQKQKQEQVCWWQVCLPGATRGVCVRPLDRVTCAGKDARNDDSEMDALLNGNCV